MGKENQTAGYAPVLTLEKIREFKGLENVTEEEAKVISETMEQLAVMLYEQFNQMEEPL